MNPSFRPAPGPAVRDLASRIRRLPPSCGPVRLVGVDGHAGSGKTTFAEQLAVALGDAPLLRLDDIASHEALFDWTARLLDQVIEPLAQGRTARYAPYDWRARRFGPPRPLPPAPVVLVEGVGAGRRALRPAWPCCCGWSWRARRPGRGDGRGTGRNSGSSGTDGSPRSAGISPMTPRDPSPISWYGSERRGTRYFRGLPGLLDRTIPSRTVTDRPQCAELVKGLAVRLAGVLQLGLTGGPYRTYVLNVRPFEPPTDAKPPVVPP